MGAWWEQSLARMVVRLIWAVAKRPWHRRAYRALLARIDALERDLQMGLYKYVEPPPRASNYTQVLKPIYGVSVLHAAASAAYSFSPNMMWPVDDHGDIQFMPKKQKPRRVSAY